MGSFSNRPGSARSGHKGVTPIDNYLAGLGKELWWARKIPD